MFHSGQSLLEQKRLQWAREREEMSGLGGIWGNFDRGIKEKPSTDYRRNSLLPPIQSKVDEQRAEESETSGYISETPPHDVESSAESQQQFSAMSCRDNYWADRKAQKNFRNESRLRGTPDSVLSTPEDRPKWGDRGLGVGYLWEPVVEFPDSRLPQVYESFRATPRWVERGLKLADGNQAEILYIQHEEEEQPTKFLLGQNAPLPPEIIEERERKRQKALEHQNAIRKQLEERDMKRKEEKEKRLRDEKMEEERIIRERELERQRKEEEMRKIKEKELSEKMKEQAMREAIETAEQNAKEERKKQKKKELLKVNEALEIDMGSSRKEAKKSPARKPKEAKVPVRDSSCQAEAVEVAPPKRLMTDSSSQSDSLGLLNMSADRGLALVLDGVPDAVQLALLMPQPVPSSPRQRDVRVVSDAYTQTNRSCCSVIINTGRSRRSYRQSSRASGRSDSSDKSTSLERDRRPLRSHTHCSSSKQRSRSQPRLSIGDRPKWGINRPSVQYMKQSEKDPHYMKRLRRRRRTKEVGTCTSIPINEKLLESEVRLLPFSTDEEVEKKTEVEKRDSEKEERVLEILERGFRMISNPSSPKFVPIGRALKNEDYEITCITGTTLPQPLEHTNIVEVEVENVENQIFNFEEQSPKEFSEGDPDVESEVVDSNEEWQQVNSSFTVAEEVDKQKDHSDDEKSSETKETSSEMELMSSSGNVPELHIDSDQSAHQLPIGSESSFSPSSDSPSPRRSVPNQDATSPLASPTLELQSSPPSSGRSETKSNADDADNDDSEDEDNGAVVLGNFPIHPKAQRESLNQLTMLKMGLQKLQLAADTRSSSPISIMSMTDGE